MKLISCLQLTPGMELAEPVACQGKEIYPAHSILDAHMINRIKRYNLMCVSIMEEVDYATTHYEKVQYDASFQNFCSKYRECLDRYKGVMIAYLGTGRSIDSNVLLQIFSDCYSCIQSEKQLLDYLYNMLPNEDEMTYSQSFHAALLCGALANWLGLPENEKKTLILCGFYYDIGKWKIPNEILWKPGKLSPEEFDLVKKHPVIGFALVRNDLSLNPHIKNTIIMHHERYDGSGYPYHMKGDKIDLYARYLSIVDTYIAMASARSFRDAFTPLQIVAHFEKNMSQYDPGILAPILSRIANDQIGTKVILSDDSVWEVFLLNKHCLSRPLLRNENNDILDLAKRNDLEIKKLA